MTVTRRHVGAPRRFEHAVRDLLGDAPRRLVRRLIEEGAATLNGRPAAKGATVRGGDVVTAPILSPLVGEPALPVRILDVRDDLMVLEKPAPMATLPLDPRERGTLAGFVVGRWPGCRGVGGALTSGVVHRLDTGSSGIVLGTPDPEFWLTLRDAFKARGIRKDYAAIVAEPPPLGWILTPLAHDPRDPRRMAIGDGRGRAWPAETLVTSVDPVGERWIVRVTIRTGVTHQIRAHLASVGAPIVGDGLYGGPPDPRVRGRHALHATGIEVPRLGRHPGGRWSSPLPAELAVLA